MPMPALVKSWQFDVNNRVTFASVNQVVGELLYGIFSEALITGGAFTCIGSSTGVTATGNLSGTNVWTSGTVPVVRGGTPANLQSWIVFRDGNGWDWMVCYQGGTDNIIKMSVSPGQLWTLNGTDAAFQPTATDECIVATNTFDFAAATASLDRVWHVAWSTDKKIWRAWVYRNSVMLSFLAGEEVVSAVTSFTFAPAVVGCVSNNGQNGQAGPGGVVGANTGNGGFRTQIDGTNVLTCCGMGLSFSANAASTALSVVAPELQSASLIAPVGVANITTSYRGKLGDRIDVYAAYNNVTNQSSDSYDTQTWYGFGCVGVYPWDGSAKVIA